MRDSSNSKSSNFTSSVGAGSGAIVGFFRRTYDGINGNLTTTSTNNSMTSRNNNYSQKQTVSSSLSSGSNTVAAGSSSSSSAAVAANISQQQQQNSKRRSTFGSRLSVHSLFFPNAYSTSLGSASASSSAAASSSNATSANSNTTNNISLTPTSKKSKLATTKSNVANRSTKMSRSTNDLQNSTTTTTAIVSNSANNGDDPDGTATPTGASATSPITTMTITINRSGSTERLLSNNNKPDDIAGERSPFLDNKSTSLAPSDGDSPGSRSGSTSDHDQDSVANLSATISGTTTNSTSGGGAGGAKVKLRECPLCLTRQPSLNFPQLSYCHHRSCQPCLIQYLHMEILESRVNVTCPECNEPMHPNDIYRILSSEDASGHLGSSHRTHLIEKYEEFSVRRVLMSDPDTRWCPAPDCSYAVIASGCAACPELRCQRPGCGTLFCYHCKMSWHPNQTCDEARAQRGSFAISPIHIDTTIRPGDIKACPRCRTYIVKMNDGSCNHMICALCGAEFCWLCLREISDLHYLSPSGCTFWGKKPWSRKKKLLWQLGMLVGAPVGIALVAGLAVPAIIFGVPVWVGRKVHQKLKDSTKAKRRAAIAGSVFGSVLMSPVLASMAVGVGVPIMLAYVYGVVPLSLCRNGSCGVTASSSGVRLDLDDDIMAMTGGSNDGASMPEKAQLLKDVDKQDASTVTGFSMQSGSTHHKLQIQADVCSTGTGVGGLIGGLMSSNSKQRRSSMESGATASLCGERCYINYEEASTKALAGSTYCDDKSVHTMGSLLEGGGGSYYVEPDQTSMKGLSGSVGGAHADAKSSKSVGSSGVAANTLGQTSGANVNVDNASTVAMAGSICGITVDTSTIASGGATATDSTTTNQCSRCGGRRSSGSSMLRTSGGHHHHPHHYHVHIDDSSCVIGDERGDRSEREGSIGRHSTEPRVTRFADDPYMIECADVHLLDRHYGIMPIDEESNVTSSTLLAEDQSGSKSPGAVSSLVQRQSMEKSSSLRRFLFLRGGSSNTSDDGGKRKRSTTSIENEPSSSTTVIDLKSISTSIGATNHPDSPTSTNKMGGSGGGGEEKRCRLHRDECQCDDAEFLLLPPDAYIVQHHRFPSTVFMGASGRRFSSSSKSGPMKKSRSWSALLLDGGGGGPATTSSMAAELWSTVRGAFSSSHNGGGGGDADVEAAYHVRNHPSKQHHHQQHAKRQGTSAAGLVQRLRPGRRATVSTSAANVAASAKRAAANEEKRTPKVDIASSCTSLPESYSSGQLPSNFAGESGHVSIALPSRQRAPSDSSPSRTSATSASGNKRLSSTLVNFFKPSGSDK